MLHRIPHHFSLNLCFGLLLDHFSYFFNHESLGQKVKKKDSGDAQKRLGNTLGSHSCAKVVGVGVDLIMQKLQSGTIPVIAGFQGVCDATEFKIKSINNNISMIIDVFSIKAVSGFVAHI